jgi:hypothetical protein
MNPVSDPAGFAAGITVITVIIIVVSTVVPLAFVGLILWKVFQKVGENKALMTSGELAQAQVMQIRETGTSLNNQPEIVLALTVQRQGQPPYQAQAQTFISQLHFPRIQPGSIVPVRVDPGNPLRVTLDLNQMLSMPVMPQPGFGAQPMAQPGYGAQPMAQPGFGAQPMAQPGGVQACAYCRQSIPVGSQVCPFCKAPVQH